MGFHAAFGHFFTRLDRARRQTGPCSTCGGFNALGVRTITQLDVAPTELTAISGMDSYKDYAPTERFEFRLQVPSFGRDFGNQFKLGFVQQTHSGGFADSFVSAFTKTFVHSNVYSNFRGLSAYAA